MDAVDRALVDALRANARATYAELAREVGLSAPAVHERVGKLESAGIITGYHAAVSPQALGYSMSALVGVFLTDTTDEDYVARCIGDLAEVEDCYFVAGEESFVVKVRVPDVGGLERIIRDLGKISGVARTRSTVVLSTRFEGRTQAASQQGQDWGTQEMADSDVVPVDAAVAATHASGRSNRAVTRDAPASNALGA